MFFNILIIIIILLIGLSFDFFITIILTILAFDLFFLNSVGARYKKQIRIIQTTLNSIRQNKLKSPEDINLGRYLFEIESDMRSMFLRTQTDIFNMKKLEQSRTEFLGNVSHELRTPIFAIQGFLETLMDGAIDDPKVNKNFLAKAIQHTDNLNNLLHDLIDISMIESGQMRMSFRYFNIEEYLNEIVKEFIPQATAKNIELILHPIKHNLKLFGDKDRLMQVMVNLISNALKYTEQGKVEVSVSEEGKFGRIVVKDTGIGINNEDLNRIFERFYRVDKDRSKSVGGTGLGLAIVKHIVEAHNSKVDVKSQSGLGSEFSFLLKK